METDNQQIVLTTNQVGETVTVTLAGELDSHVETAVMTELSAAMKVDGVAALSVDLNGLSFIDSSGLRCLILAKQAATARGIDLTLETPSNSLVTKLFTICGVTELFSETR